MGHISYDSIPTSNPKILLVSVQPWSMYTPALNALIAISVQHHYPLILFQSLEVQADANHIEAMQSAFVNDDDLLVVGHGFPNCHDMPATSQLQYPLTGCTSPWNTLAMWRVDHLARTGFQLVSDGLVPGMSAHHRCNDKTEVRDRTRYRRGHRHCIATATSITAFKSAALLLEQTRNNPMAYNMAR